MGDLRLLARWLGIQPGEARVSLTLFLYLFGIITSYLMLKSARDGLFLSHFGALKLPYAMMATSVVAAGFVGGYLRLLRYIALPRLILLSLAFFISNVLLFWWVSRYQFGWLYFVIYVWTGLFGVIGPMQVWSLANQLLTTRQAKRLFGVIGAGGILGGITGGFIAAAVARTLSTEALLPTMAAGLTVCMGLVVWSTQPRKGLPEPGTDSIAPESDKSRPSFTQSVRWITASRYLLLITSLIVLSRVVSTVVDYQFKATVGDAMEDKDQLTSFFGLFYGYLGLVSLGIQLLLTRRILERLGIGFGLLLLPSLMVLGSGAFFLMPGLVAATVLRGSNQLLKHSVDKSSVELLYLPVSGEMKYSAKSFIDTVVWRVSDGTAGLLLLLFATVLQLSPRQLVWVSLPLLVPWLLAAYRGRAQYVKTLRSSIQRRILDPQKVFVEWREPATREALRASLMNTDERELLHTLETVEWADLRDLAPDVRKLTHHSSAQVRARALTLLTNWRVPGAVLEAEQLLNDDHLDVRTEAVMSICMIGPEEPQRKLQSLLYHPVPRIQAAAVLCALQQGEGKEVQQISRQIFETIIAQRDPDSAAARRDVARALGHPVARGIAEGLLPQLLEDPQVEVRRAALYSVTRYANPRWLPLLLGQLGDPQTKGAALEALTSYGSLVVPTLAPWLTDQGRPAAQRIRVAKLFGRIETSEVVNELLTALPERQADVRHQVLKSLNRIHRRHPEWALPRPLLVPALQREAEQAYQLMAGLNQTKDSSGILTDPDFLRWALDDRLSKALERIFRLLGLLYPWDAVYSAYMAIRSEQRVAQANALEYLEQTLEAQLKAIVLPLLLPELDWEGKLKKGEQAFAQLKTVRVVPWLALLREPDPLLRICLLASLRPEGEPILRGLVARLAQDADPRVRQAAERALAPHANFPEEQNAVTSMSVVEKLKYLQSVDIFSRTDLDGLAHLAALGQDQHYGKGEVIFHEHGPPDAVYCLLDGRVGLTQVKGEKACMVVDPYQAFGVYAILDRKPRIFTAKALQPATVLQIRTDDFYDELADHIEIVQGVFDVLGSHLRELLK